MAKKIEQKCKCHGVSGSCTLKTCWTVAPELPRLVEALRSKYKRALQVVLAANSSTLLLSSNQDVSSRQQRSLRQNNQIPATNELVFIEESPDICSLRQPNGAPLSAGRECTDEEECRKLCCNRGFISIREAHIVRCNCQVSLTCSLLFQSFSSFIVAASSANNATER